MPPREDTLPSAKEWVEKLRKSNSTNIPGVLLAAKVTCQQDDLYLFIKFDTVDLAPSAMNNRSYQADLGDRRVVSPKAGSEMAAALGLQYFESSAKDQTGVEVRSLAGSENRTNERWTKPSKVVQACHPDENQTSLFFPLDPDILLTLL